MPARRIRRVRMVAVQGAALVVATLFLALAIAGFQPHVTHVLGVFKVSVADNVLHLCTAIAGLLLARNYALARAYLIGGGAFFVVLWLAGVAQERLRAIVGLGGADGWLHLGAGVIMVVLGLTLAAGRVPTGAEGEVLVTD